MRSRKPRIRALHDMDLDLEEGECLALVGESGSGKTTLGRCLLRLIEPTEGKVYFDNEDIMALSKKRLRHRRRHFQMIFQDPWSSLNPRMRVGEAIVEPLVAHRLPRGGQRKVRLGELIAQVGLSESIARRFPHELSGGQRQRVAIARALATEPRLLIADEPVSALDVSVQAEILNLLSTLQERLALTLLFISHDLALVEHLADRVMVLYLGRIVEQGPREAIFDTPAHPYTAGLLKSVPSLNPRKGPAELAIPGEVPSPASPPSGCVFHPRCTIARPECSITPPHLERLGEHREVACHFPGEA